MVYKIGNTQELSSIPIASNKAKEILYHFSRVLENEYGAERDINSVGGYILYAPPGTPAKNIKEIFDYSSNNLDYGEIFDDIFYSVHIIGDDFGVVIVASAGDGYDEILAEIKRQKENKNDS